MYASSLPQSTCWWRQNWGQVSLELCWPGPCAESLAKGQAWDLHPKRFYFPPTTCVKKPFLKNSHFPKNLVFTEKKNPEVALWLMLLYIQKYTNTFPPFSICFPLLPLETRQGSADGSCCSVYRTSKIKRKDILEGLFNTRAPMADAESYSAEL